MAGMLAGWTGLNWDQQTWIKEILLLVHLVHLFPVETRPGQVNYHRK